MKCITETQVVHTYQITNNLLGEKIMCNTFRSALGRLLYLPTVGLATAALAVCPAWSQQEKTDATKESAKDTAKDSDRDDAERAKDAKDKAQDTAKNAKDTAKDTAKSTKDSAKNTSKSTADRAKQSAKDTGDRAKSNAKDAAKTQRDTTKGTRDTARDAARDTRRDARDTARDTRDADRDTRTTRDRRDAGDDRNLDDDRDIDSRDARDVRDSRNLRDDRDDRDIDRRDINRRDMDRRDVNVDRRDIDRRDIDVDRRDIDRRDVRTDVRNRTDIRDRTGARVSRSRIDNFRADSVTARDLGVTFGRATADGLVIQDLSRNAVLADIGLRRNDVIVSVANHQVASEREFFRWLFAEDLRRDRVTLVVLRDGREVPLYVRPVSIIEDLVLVSTDYDPLQQFGVVIDDRRPREVVVTRVLPGTPAFRSGIRQGDVITTFRGQRLIGPQQFVQVLSTVDPGTVPFEVTRNRQVQELQVEMPRMARQTVVGPDLGPTTPGIERREERRENRIERREERRDGTPGVQPVTPVPQPRPAILPRNR
jgi:hypothetical protein